MISARGFLVEFPCHIRRLAEFFLSIPKGAIATYIFVQVSFVRH